jgi:transcriptional regulator with GAF, ATPase, and Fis domain
MWLLTAALLVVAAASLCTFVVKLLTPQHPPSDNNSNQTRSRWEWPGNVRELENFIERAVILSRGKTLEVPLPELSKSADQKPAHAAATPAQEDIVRIVKETISALDGRNRIADEFATKQREEIIRALTETKGRVGGPDGAAARMGLNRTTLLARMKKFGIDPREYA